MNQPDPVILDMLTELTRPHTHTEPYHVPVGLTVYGRRHRTQVPSLLHQLQHASPSGDGASRSSGYESRPTAQLEALDTLVRIDLEAARWVRELGEDDPGTTTACVSLLGGLLASADRCKRKTGSRTCCTAHSIEHDIRRWYTQARVVTGWDTPAWRPDATCPMCAVRGGLRVRLEDRSAICVECRETWDASTYQRLAEHVRTESEARRRERLDDAASGDVASGQNRGW